jgi:hypothetical protein
MWQIKCFSHSIIGPIVCQTRDHHSNSRTIQATSCKGSPQVYYACLHIREEVREDFSMQAGAACAWIMLSESNSENALSFNTLGDDINTTIHQANWTSTTAEIGHHQCHHHRRSKQIRSTKCARQAKEGCRQAWGGDASPAVIGKGCLICTWLIVSTNPLAALYNNHNK